MDDEREHWVQLAPAMWANVRDARIVRVAPDYFVCNRWRVRVWVQIGPWALSSEELTFGEALELLEWMGIEDVDLPPAEAPLRLKASAGA